MPLSSVETHPPPPLDLLNGLQCFIELANKPRVVGPSHF